MGNAAPGDGLRLGHDLLAPAAGLAGRRRLASAPPQTPRPARRGRPPRPDPGRPPCPPRPRHKGGAGHPTLVWIATQGETGFYEEDENGNPFKLVPWEHVAVAYAYDEGGVSISDPGTGALSYLSWGWLLNAWSVLDGMALSI